MIVGKATSLKQSWAFERCFTRVGSGSLERPEKDKHSILLWPFINYDHKKFYNIGAWRQYYKTFYVVIYECLQ